MKEEEVAEGRAVVSYYSATGGTPMSQPEPYVPNDPFSAAGWRVAEVDESAHDQVGYFEAWLEWLAARNRVNERLDEAKPAELEER